jgi:hypothetical protein
VLVLSNVFRTESLATLKLHYDGWLVLPASLRQSLDLKTGDRLEAELVDGAIVLRSTHGKRAPAEPAMAVGSPAVTSAAAPSAGTTVPAKRPRGRPRKVPAVVETQRHLERALDIAEAPLPSPRSSKREPDAPQKDRDAELEPVSEPEPQPRAGDTEPWKLRPKAELAAPKREPIPLPPPLRRREPSWTGGGYEREERRPFRNVEVRKLGPGRGHNRPRREVNSGGVD